MRGSRRQHMSLYSDDKSQNAPIVAPRSWLRATIVAALAMVFVGAAVGFVGFLSQLHGAEIKPDHKADGIVVLTGGSSRAPDPLAPLARGHGKRPVSSGVDPHHAARPPRPSLSEH